jgi:hypothetical protein
MLRPTVVLALIVTESSSPVTGIIPKHQPVSLSRLFRLE